MPRRPPNLFDLVDDFLDNLVDQARTYIREGIENAGIPTQLPTPSQPTQPRTQPHAQPRATPRRRTRSARPAKTGPNHYDTLEVAPTASQEAISGAYRALARKYHPDTHKGARAAQKIRDINLAYSVIGRPEKRREYDKEMAKK